MEQVTHKHLDPTPIEHKLMRGPPQRGRIGRRERERERERERDFPFFVFGKKD